MSQITGAEIVFKAFADHGVEYIFGYPGGAILPLYDELRNHKKIKHILVDMNKEQDMQQKVMQDHQENQELF